MKPPDTRSYGAVEVMAAMRGPRGDDVTALLPAVGPPASKRGACARVLLACAVFAGVSAAGIAGWRAWVRAPPQPELVSVILTADPGDMVGLSERSILEEHMTDMTSVPLGEILCDSIIEGRCVLPPATQKPQGNSLKAKRFARP